MYKTTKRDLYCPSPENIIEVLENGLRNTFSYVKAELVACPNMKEKPFMLASEGICGNPVLADVGGVPYLVPLAQKDKIYNINEIAKQMKMPNALVLGAGAGPRHHVGINCEEPEVRTVKSLSFSTQMLYVPGNQRMMANIKLGEDYFNNTHVARLGKNNECQLIHLKDSTEFCLLGNLFLSEGKPGKVLKVVAKHRKVDGNFVTTMREALAGHYKDKPVGMGGVFIIKSGKAKLHIMPDYSDTPLNTNEDVNNWLKFFNMSAPLVCLSTFISSDPGLDLRVEHTHCFSDHGEGGHYHEDTEAEIVEYEGYFSMAESIHRFDPPSVTHNVGRD